MRHGGVPAHCLEQKDMSPAELAAAVGSPRSTIDALIKGRAKEPALSEAKAIADALGVSLEEMDAKTFEDAGCSDGRVEQIGLWMFEPAKKIGAALVGACAVAGTALACLQWAGVEFDGFIGAVTNYLPLWFPPTAFAFGICIGWYARGRSQRVSRSERRYLERREQEGLEEDFEKAKMSFCALDANIKALMLAALDKGGAYCNGTDWRFSCYSDAQFIAQFVSTRYIDGDIAKITATPPLDVRRGA